MPKPTRALLWCLLLLAAAEAGVRAFERAVPTTGTIGIDERLVLLLGTSRTQHGLNPVWIERALAAGGVQDVFVANASRLAATNVGLLQEWAHDVLPAVAGHGRGLVAIEMRVEGFNDSYQAEVEGVSAEQLEIDGQDLSALQGDGPLALLGKGKLDAASWWLLSRSHLCALPELLRRHREAAELTPKQIQRHLPAWAVRDRGWEPMPRDSTTRNLERIQQHYRDQVLADFSHGGRQTSAVRELVASVRAIGMTPVLYLMPITDDHRTVYPDGLWDQMLTYIRALADELHVDFVDLDIGHGLPPTLFVDSSHLSPEGAEIMSARLAERVLLPRLR